MAANRTNRRMPQSLRPFQGICKAAHSLAAGLRNSQPPDDAPGENGQPSALDNVRAQSERILPAPT